jgi:hypothetical protein
LALVKHEDEVRFFICFFIACFYNDILNQTFRFQLK